MSRIIPMTKEEAAKYIHANMPTVGKDWSIEEMERLGLLFSLPGRDPELPELYVPYCSYSKWHSDPAMLTSLKRLSDEYMLQYDLKSRYRVELLFENGDKINFGLYVQDEPAPEREMDDLEL